MKIVIAPDSFKETLSSLEVCKTIKEGFMHHLPSAEYELVPIADGGEGMMRTLCDSLGGKLCTLNIRHPWVDNKSFINAHFAYIPSKKLVVLESAEAVGLDLISKEKRNPFYASTYGLGEIMNHIRKEFIDTGKANAILIGIGGTSTVDGGMGMLQAMGAKFFDKYDKDVGLGGLALTRVARMDMSQFRGFKDGSCEITMASDVQNPLLGKMGAAHIFGPQKGASPEMVAELEEGMQNFASIIAKHFKIKKSEVDFPCGGAAGGLGMALPVFYKARIQSGIEIVISYVGLEEKLKDANVLITGEGKVDGQSLQGKVVYGVLQSAKKYKVPVCVIGGCLDKDYETLYELGAHAIFSATPMSTDWETLKRDARKNLYNLAKSISAMIKLKD